MGVSMEIFVRNTDVRSEMTYLVNGITHSIPLWVIANQLGIHENTFRSWLNKKDMTSEKKKAVLTAIYDIKKRILDEMQVHE